MKTILFLFSTLLFCHPDGLEKRKRPSKSSPSATKKAVRSTDSSLSGKPFYLGVLSTPTTVNHRNPPRDIVKTMVQAANGELWIGAWSGIFRYSPALARTACHRNTCTHRKDQPDDRVEHRARLNEAFLNISSFHGLQDQHIMASLRDQKGRIWLSASSSFGAEPSLYRIGQTGGKPLEFKPGTGLPSGTIYALGEDAQGKIWLGTETGLFILQNPDAPETTWNFLEIPLPASGTAVRTIRLDEQQNAWLGTAAGLFQVKNTQSTKPEVLAIPAKNGKPFSEVRGILPNRDGSLWIGHRDGLSLLYRDPSGQMQTGLEGSFAGNRVWTCLLDKTGRMWVGLTDAAGQSMGLVRVENPEASPATWKKTTFSAKDGLETQRVHSLFEDKSGQLWLGTDWGVYQFLEKRKKDKFRRFESPMDGC